MARSEDDGVVLGLLIVGLVEVASGALVNIVATAVEDVVGLATALWLCSSSAGNCTF